jgi:spore coat protein U-like protein
MKTQVSIFVKIICLFVFGGYATASFAATANGTLGVNAVVGVGCQVNNGVSSGSINFGNLSFGNIYAISSQNVDGQTTGSGNGSIVMECSTGTAFTISLDNGQHFTSGTRAMANSTNSAVLLNYALYQNSARTVPWTSASPLTATSTGVATTYDVYGRIPGGQSGITAGTYNDTVQVVITW